MHEKFFLSWKQNKRYYSKLPERVSLLPCYKSLNKGLLIIFRVRFCFTLLLFGLK